MTSTGTIVEAEPKAPLIPLSVAIECANASSARDDPNNDPVYSMQQIFERRGHAVTIVNGSSIDTLEKLDNYDVVVVGDSGFGEDDFTVFQSALKDWVEAGGGLVSTGWILYGLQDTGMNGSEIDELLPVSPDYDFEYEGSATVAPSGDSPVFEGVDEFPVYSHVEFPASHAVDPGATVLGYTISAGNMNSTLPMQMPVVVSWQYDLGRSIYLGPIYFADFSSYDNEGLYSDVDAVRLLLNAVEWAAGTPPEPITAECMILCNQDNGDYASACALDFTIEIPDVDFAWMDVQTAVPTHGNLSSCDVVLLFEDGLFPNAPNVGSAVYDYVMAGGNLVIGTFYEQDRSDCTNYSPNGWGLLEDIDPFTSDGVGCEYNYDELNVSSIVAHPITAGVTSLWCNEYHGGVHAKADTAVVANWTSTNDLGEPCPLAGYRILEDHQRVVQISIYPAYYAQGALDTVFGGDFYRLWGNALVWASQALYTGPSVLKGLTQLSTGHMEEAPDIALDQNGNLHVIWIGNDTANLYYMMLDADGNVLINETCLDPSPNATSSHVRRASVGVDSDNNVHIVFHALNWYEPWPEYANNVDLNETEVAYLRISPYLDDMDGSAADYMDITLQPETIISTDDGVRSRAPNLAVDSLDRVHVVWFDNDIKGTTGELHYLVMDNDGGLLLQETNITDGIHTDVDWSEPEIVTDSNNDAHVFLVTENWNGSSGTWRDIWYTMIDGTSGLVLIDNTQLTYSNETWRFSRPFVAIDSEDKIHIAWHDSRFNSNGTGLEEIYYMVIDPYLDDRSGDAADPMALRVVDELAITGNDGDRSFLANIAIDGNDMSHLVWLDEPTNTWNDIYYGLVDASGNILYSEYPVTNTAGTLDWTEWYSSSNRNPEVTVANGRVYIVDMAYDLGTEDYDVWLTILHVDKSPPTTTIHYSAYSYAGQDWLSAGSPITLLATDDESNMTGTYYRIDMDLFGPYEGPFNLSGLAEGAHVIAYHSIDFYGNEEPVNFQTVYLDSVDPVIDEPTRHPTGDIPYTQAVTIKVNVTDSGCGVGHVFLNYTINDGSSWTNLEMYYNGTNGLYERTIPAQAYGVTVKYSVSASDNVGNDASRDNSGSYYTYPVVPEFAAATLIALFTTLSLAAAILARKRNRRTI